MNPNIFTFIPNELKETFNPTEKAKEGKQELQLEENKAHIPMDWKYEEPLLKSPESSNIQPSLVPPIGEYSMPSPFGPAKDFFKPILTEPEYSNFP